MTSRDRAYEKALDARDRAERRARDEGIPPSKAADLARDVARQIERTLTTSTTSTDKDKP